MINQSPYLNRLVQSRNLNASSSGGEFRKHMIAKQRDSNNEKLTNSNSINNLRRIYGWPENHTTESRDKINHTSNSRHNNEGVQKHALKNITNGSGNNFNRGKLIPLSKSPQKSRLRPLKVKHNHIINSKE
jgi:hypothetical protein